MMFRMVPTSCVTPVARNGRTVFASGNSTLSRNGCTALMRFPNSVETFESADWNSGAPMAFATACMTFARTMPTPCPKSRETARNWSNMGCTPDSAVWMEPKAVESDESASWNVDDEKASVSPCQHDTSVSM